LLSRLIERLRARGVPPSELSAEDARSELAAELAAVALPGAPPLAESEGPEPWPGTYVEWSCRVVRDLASALEHAHSKSVVHRDVKPSNVLVRRDGRALLFDFGLAHVQDQPTLTRSGDFAGTPYAVAPEQVDAVRGSIEARTDVWGLGVVLYELLALDRLFVEEVTSNIIEEVARRPLPDLRRRIEGLDPGLESILRHALDQDPVRRPTAALMGADLDRWIAAQRAYASPDQLQSHLALLFPHDFRSPTRDDPHETGTGFSALERAVALSAGRAGLLHRWFGR